MSSKVKSTSGGSNFSHSERLSQQLNQSFQNMSVTEKVAAGGTFNSDSLAISEGEAGRGTSNTNTSELVNVEGHDDLMVSLVNYEEGTFVNSQGKTVDEVGTETLKMKQSQKEQNIRNVLDSFLPPAKISQDSDVHKRVSNKAATREDVTELQGKLDSKLQIRQARESGICPVREQLYSQTFDELIRQITIEEPSRGLMLLRVRDEAKMTIAAYRTLYANSIAFGTRKAVQAESGLQERLSQIQAKEEKRKRLETEAEILRQKYQRIEKGFADQRTREAKKRAQEKEFLKHQKTHLTKFLEDTESKQKEQKESEQSAK